jgi:hypothetical protein
MKQLPTSHLLVALLVTLAASLAANLALALLGRPGPTVRPVSSSPSEEPPGTRTARPGKLRARKDVPLFEGACAEQLTALQAEQAELRRRIEASDPQSSFEAAAPSEQARQQVEAGLTRALAGAPGLQMDSLECRGRICKLRLLALLGYTAAWYALLQAHEQGQLGLEGPPLLAGAAPVPGTTTSEHRVGLTVWLRLADDQPADPTAKASAAGSPASTAVR